MQFYKCRQCNQNKSKICFSKNKRNKISGINTRCKVCDKQYLDNFRAIQKQKLLEQPKINKLNCIGKKINKLTIQSYFIKGVGKSAHGYLKCSCECGKFTEVNASTLLYQGRPLSCGCAKKTYEKEASTVNRLYSSYKSSCKQRNCGVFAISKDEFCKLIKQPCYYCTIPPQERYNDTILLGYFNGIDRKNSSEGYTITNCVPCCTICNRAKINLPYSKFKDYINRIRKRSTDLI